MSFFGNIGERFSRGQENIQPQNIQPAHETIKSNENLNHEAIKEVEIAIRNLQFTIESNQRQIAQLQLDLASIQVGYFDNPEHPGVRADKKFRADSEAEIARLESETAIYEERLKEKLQEMRELKLAA